MDNQEVTTSTVRQIVSNTARTCFTDLKYTIHPSEEINTKIDIFHKKFGDFPTFEQIKSFNDREGGVNCNLFVQAACDILRSQGITAEQVNLLDPKTSKGAADNHSVVYAADHLWMEPQTGEIFEETDWDAFALRYSKLLGIAPEDLVAYSLLSQRAWMGKNWTAERSIKNS